MYTVLAVGSKRWSEVRVSDVELITRDKANLDLVWLKDDSIEDAADLPSPDVLAREIMEDLQAALNGFQAIVDSLDEIAAEPGK